MDTMNIPILYVLVDNDVNSEQRFTIFHLLRESEIALLRCFMALLFFPANTSRIIPEQPPFAEAMIRVRELPTFRKANGSEEPDPRLWSDMLRAPLLVIMVTNMLPSWLENLVKQRALILLSASDELLTAATKDGVFSGLLRGFDDIRAFYAALGQLADRISTDNRFKPEERSTLRALGQPDLFKRRPRLEFIPALPLPQPSDGRPAAYLLNRLSNNVDTPSLLADTKKNGAVVLPQMLSLSTRACSALAMMELSMELPAHLSLPRTELEDIHAKIAGSTTDHKTKFDMLLELGRKLSQAEWPERPFVTVPTPRLDLVRGQAPEGIRLDPGHKQRIRSGVRALNDLITGIDRTTFRSKKEEQTYGAARQTLLSEQRLIACQTSFLAARSEAVPVQLSPVPSLLYNELNDLNRALDANSRKIPDLFRGVEFLLSKVLPKGLLEHLDEGHSPVTLFSDLPFEWTLVNEWPLCLTRPVSRIPIANNHWDILAAALEFPASIDTRRPERVLVFDLLLRALSM